MSYIEREAALDAISEWLMKALHTENMSSYNEGERAAYRTALSEIANLPTADVRPVVRGKWISGDARNVTAVCSNCGRLRLGNGAESATKYAPFCEKCGAYMREES